MPCTSITVFYVFPRSGKFRAAGTEVTLTAEPDEGKAFNMWKLYDPNHPGDANYVVTDANNPITLLMNGDYEVEVKFKCGSGLEPMLPVMLGVLGACVWVRRRF